MLPPLMDVTTETDRFIAEQLGPLLRPYEKPLAAAYLLTVPGASLVSAFMTRAFFGVLTNERLILLETRVGAFRPVLENKGVESIERGEIEGAVVSGSQISFQLTGGRKGQYTCQKRHKHVSGQALFRETIARDHGTGPVAEAMAQKNKRAIFGAIAATIALAGLGGYLAHMDTAHVEVACKGHESGGVLCTATHTSGGADAHTCFTLVLTCEKGQVRKPSCIDVEPEKTADLMLSLDEIPGMDTCEGAISLKIIDLEIVDP